MKKRIISLLMMFCMVFSLMPATPARADHEEADITGGTRQSDGVPVYVYAEAIYDGSPYVGPVEGLKLNNSGWVTIGKLIQQDLPQEKDEETKDWPSYGADSEQLKAVVKELDTDRFTYHDAGVAGCRDMVSSWTSLAGQYGDHDGYKTGDPENDGPCLGYHLNGQINVYKVTFDYGGTKDEKYYPQNTTVTRPATDPKADSQWFVNWVDQDGNPYDFSTPVTGDVTITAQWTDDIPVYVYARTMYQGTLCTENVEGVTHNNNGFLTLGKMFTTQRLVLENGKTYPLDEKTAKAVIAELDTADFVPHDDSVAGYLDLVDEWIRLICNRGTHDGYKGENPGDPNNDSVWAYHLDGAIDVCKVTFVYGNGTENVVRYYPESNEKKTIRVVRPADPSIDGKWFLGWYTADGQLYDFDSSVTADLVLTARWRDMEPAGGPDVSTVMLRVRDVNEKHAAAHGGADYRLQPTDGTGSGIQEVNGVYTYTFTVTDPADFLNRYNAGEGNGTPRGTHRLAGTSDLTVTWTWGRNGWECQNPDLGQVNGAMTSEAPVAVMLDAECPFTVTFENNGGTFAAQEVYPGGTAARPAAPTAPDSGVKFAGWYSGEKPYDFSTPVTDDLTLTAKWGVDQGTVKMPYYIEYYVEDENGAFMLASTDRTHSAPAGAAVSVDPAALTVPAHHVYDEERSRETASGTVTQPTVENGAVTDLLTLKVYFRWDSHTVDFDSSGGTAVASVTVKHGQTAAAPDAPTRSGYRFDGWYLGDAAYDFSTPVTDDLTLTARWTRRSGGGSTRYAVTVAESGHGSVSASHKSAASGTLVTVTAEPDDGYQVKEVTVMVDRTGKTVKLTDKGGGTFTFTMPAGAVTVRADFVKENSFADVPSDAYYKDAVDWAEKNGITGGVSADAFAPDRICTRAQAVTFLWRAAGNPEPETAAMPFADVPMDSYYYKAVQWAVENGVTKGTTDTTFSPDLTCSRSHIVTFLWRAAKCPAPDSVNPFTDVPAGAYYAEAVQWAVENGITRGTTDTAFSPAQGCTRAQIVTFLYRQYSK